MLPHMTKYQAEIQNMNLDDADVEALIQKAIDEAATEIREHLLTQRRVESDSQQRKRELEAERQRNANEIRTHREMELEVSFRRTEALRQAESMPPQRKRGMWE